MDHGDEDIVRTAGAEIVHDLQPELCPLGLIDPQAEDFPFPILATLVVLLSPTTVDAVVTYNIFSRTFCPSSSSGGVKTEPSVHAG